MSIFKEIFAWWTGNTIALRLQTMRNGTFMGEDEVGNRYYQQTRGNGPLGKPRRWVIYSDIAEASLVPAKWHGWLHHTVDTPPDDTEHERHWQQPHRPNLTGTQHAYRPSGSILNDTERAKATGDYEAWRPE